MPDTPVTNLTSVDYAVMAVYFAVVLGVGWILRRVMRTSTDFFLSGRSLPAWITGIAFISANLGAQEVIGMGASGAKYGIATSHFYWVGLEGRAARGARQHLPADIEDCRARVASANVRGGCPELPARRAKVRPTLPVLDFPEPGLDDTAAYQGYQTRFYRDSKQNTVQVYLEPQGGRVVTLWADAANESVGFTVRAGGRPARLSWGAGAAEVTDSVPARSIEYRLVSDASRLELGGFLLGSMRVERDYQYAKRHFQPLDRRPFRVAEELLLVTNVARLPDTERDRHLALLHAGSVEMLRDRLGPTLASACSDTLCTVRVERPSLDAKNRLILELGADPRVVKVQLSRGTVSIRTRSGAPIQFAVKVTTDAAPLIPLQRNQIFNQAFLKFLARAAGATDSAGQIRYRRMERQVRGVELLSSKEKLMAGLPNFATYFGRDMMMTALMMRPIWTAGMSQHVIASVLRKLGPGGDVSHEEALGGQAIRENAVVYDSLISGYFRVARARRRQQADSLLEQARTVLGDLQKTRENYHMIDDELQLPVLSARYLGDPAVSPQQKRAFLLDSSDSRGPRLALLLREMALVATWTAPYVEDPRPANLVSFPKRDATHWRSASWRDSDAGYAGGRFAMDVNALWVPQALESIGLILVALPRVGINKQDLQSIAPSIRDTPLAQYLANPASLARAIESWKGARRHFEVMLGPVEVRRQVRAKLAWLPAAERRYWQKIMTERKEMADSLSFLALSLDAGGTPIPVVNTDPATGLFLGSTTEPETVLRDVEPFALRYPLGLLVDSLGPLVANDAYASRQVWDRFRADIYHSPRVVWGREVNLLFLGLANRIKAAFDSSGRLSDPGLEPYANSLQDVLQGTTRAVEASGLGYNELWSYRIEGGGLLPIRYGTSSDVQLWNTTDLAVEFVLSTLPKR
jgi:hypothetical protein